MTPSPTPAISEERVGEIEALARRLVDIRVAKKALVDAEEWEQAAAKREEERVAQRAVVEWLNESPAEFLALIARLREASEDTGRLARVESGACAKCGESEKIGCALYEAGERGGYGSQSWNSDALCERERLEFNCRRCGHEWWKPTLDAARNQEPDHTASPSPESVT